jgi:homoserine dehydrogenase
VLGIGTVGGGVLRRLAQEPERYELLGASARDPHTAHAKALRHDLPSLPLTDDPAELLSRRPDVLVELIGGVEPALAYVRRALGAGLSVVTANKALIAEHGPELDRLASRHGARLLRSASVGGALPALEITARAADLGTLRSIRGVLNGTSNFVLNELAAGRSLEQALAGARELGYAEADASLDLSGADAAHKLAVLAQSLGLALRAGEVQREPIDEHTAARIADRGPLRQTATLRPEPGRLLARVALEPARGLFRDLPGAQNAIEIELDDGRSWFALAAGAGRWPTTEAVIADLNDLHAGRHGALHPAPQAAHKKD